MKKISYWAFAATAMAFVACDEIDKSIAEPSTNPQETIFEASNLSVTPAQGALNLQALAGQDAQAEVATYQVTDFPENSTLHFVMQFSADDEFAEYGEVSADAQEGAIMVDPTAFDEAYYSKITQSPDQAVIAVRFIAQAVNGSEVARIGGPDVYFGAGELTITPFDAVEDAYFLVDPATGDKIEMSHSSDKAGWEDPVFSTIIEAPADGFAWAIEGASGAVAYVPENAEALSGTLVAVAPTDAYAPGIIPEGPYKLEVNMRTLKYEISLAIKQLYTPGNSNGWNFGASQVLTTYNYIKYTGYVHIDGEYKFTAQADWKGICYGQGSEEGSLSTAPDAKNLSAENGLYWCTVDVANLMYKNEAITSLGVIGDFNGWSAQSNMTPSEDFLTWTGSVTMDAGQAFKFRANDKWDINLGGELDNLTLDGNNLVAPASGTYTVSLNLSAVPYTASLELQQ